MRGQQELSLASKSAPSGAALAEPEPIVGEGAVTRVSMPATLDTPFRARKDKSGQVTLAPSMDKGLRDYRTRAKAAAEEVAAGGPSRGVLTFSRPVSLGDLAELQATGLVIESIEQYGRRNKDAKDVVMNDVYWSLAGWAD